MTIALNSIIPLKKGTKYEDIPISPNPHFLAASEGIFLRKTSALGTSTIRVDVMPRHLGDLGNPKGFFDFNAPIVPAEICAQIVDFFRRTWDKHQTEAEVLLTARIEVEEGYPKIKEWRVFIPTQKVSMGGVDSVYDPTHIAKGHQVVGSMHSHCNFGAYHSGTDTGDAKGFDGIHFTIGHVDKEKPQVVSMVSMNGTNVDFNPEVVSDFSNLKAASAPTWWDNYLIPSKDVKNSDKIIGFDNFSRFERKPAWQGGGSNLPPITPAWQGGSQSHYPYGGAYGGGGRGYYENRPYAGTKTLKELRDEEEANFKKKSEQALLPADTRSTAPDLKPVVEVEPRSTDDRTIDKYNAEYWEDDIDNVLRDILFDNNLLTDDDIDDIMANLDNLDTFMRALLVQKLIGTRKALKLMGVDITVTVNKHPNEKKFNKKRRKGILSGRN